MRQIGTLGDQSQATLLADYLVSQGIRAHAEQEENGWVVWVRDESQLDRARDEFRQFLADPQDPRPPDEIAAFLGSLRWPTPCFLGSHENTKPRRESIDRRRLRHPAGTRTPAGSSSTR